MVHWITSIIPSLFIKLVYKKKTRLLRIIVEVINLSLGMLLKKNHEVVDDYDDVVDEVVEKKPWICHLLGDWVCLYIDGL